jgi:long-chain acyl-CoA synthetase
MHLGAQAKANPHNLAVVDAGTGRSLTYETLDKLSLACARFLRRLGLTDGDVIGIMMENRPEFFIPAWAAQRSGLYYCAISTRLVRQEVAYILSDSSAKVLFISATTAELASEAAREAGTDPLLVSVDELPSTPYLFGELARSSDLPMVDEKEGADLLYSSGTTGRPKGVKFPLPLTEMGTAPSVALLLAGLYGMKESSVYLSPAPLYHAAPLRFTMGTLRLGATVVIMPRFDPVEFLAAIERYKVTHTQVVPTMFVRLLKLDERTRRSYDLSSLQCVIHASAPCPIEVKRAVIEWLGPIVYEYYAGTEANGFVCCNSEEWLAHPGTVGKPLLGKIHILGDDFEELPPGVDGVVYFESPTQFEYLHDPEKTNSSRSPQGYTTLGDIGHVDEDGYLYLTDRKHNMIISGGVNIYPQEIENVLASHPAVLDSAVFGIPDEEMGEKVVAVIQLADPEAPREALRREIEGYLRERLASYKVPRIIEFRDELPREPTGKLLKRKLREEYIARRAM